MVAYYNEIDPFAARWLRNLIAADLIAPGEVDTRSIEDVSPDDLRGFTQCHFFAGIGVWSHALRLGGISDDYPVWTGSCPCQPFSCAGSRRGLEDERHLWPEFMRLISERRPTVVLGEQVASKAGLEWLDHISANLEAANHAVAAADLCAAGVGLPHIRQRLYWVAYSERYEQPRQEPCRWAAGRVGRKQQSIPKDAPWQSALRELRAVDDGTTYGVAATDAVRNALAAPVAAEFVRAALT